MSKIRQGSAITLVLAAVAACGSTQSSSTSTAGSPSAAAGSPSGAAGSPSAAGEPSTQALPSGMTPGEVCANIAAVDITNGPITALSDVESVYHLDDAQVYTAMKAACPKLVAQVFPYGD